MKFKVLTGLIKTHTVYDKAKTRPWKESNHGVSVRPAALSNNWSWDGFNEIKIV